MPDETPESLMRRETGIRHGAVPDSIAGLQVGIGHHRLIGDEFLLRHTDFACFYRKGDGITVQLDDPAGQGALDLFLAGSVHSAVAAINGLLPVHASAVEVSGRVIAFSGDSGAGKSTTAAALRQRGFPIVADDTLVLDTSTLPPACLPGHKRLKLWPDSLGMTGLSGLQIVSEAYPKYFATEEGSDVRETLPLAAIVALEVANDLAFEPVRGGARIALLDDDHYTAHFHAIANGHDRAARLAMLAQFANGVPAYRFSRPIDPARFAETIDFLVGAVSDLPAP